MQAQFSYLFEVIATRFFDIMLRIAMIFKRGCQFFVFIVYFFTFEEKLKFCLAETKAATFEVTKRKTDDKSTKSKLKREFLISSYHLKVETMHDIFTSHEFYVIKT